MSEVHFDPVVANRFISSLSKSLQALCHGCMDFDSGLEIGGHIYIKIDYESKVDYVLDEKVEKSNDNSMKFVSNSFLAKKDKPKQTSDGSCSPVQELQTPPPPPPPVPRFHQRTAYKHPGSQHQRPYHPYSNASGGGNKRGSGAIKSTDRKQSRPPSYGGNSTSTYPSTSGNINNDDNSFLQQHSVPNTDDIDNGTNVKQEFLEGGESSQRSDSINGECNFDPIDSKMNIKNEPDTAYENEVEKTAINRQEFSEETNPTSAASTNYEQYSDQSQCASNSNDEHHNVIPTHSKSSYEPTVDKNNEWNTNSEVSVHFNTESESVYPETSQPNAGESLNFGGDFDVIEIDDEDEEMEGMFDGSHEQTLQQYQTKNAAFREGTSLTQYGTEYDSTPKPFICNLCGRGYMTDGSLKRHMVRHEGKTLKCPICDRIIATATKWDLKRHLKKIHKSSQCFLCLKVFSLDSDTFHLCHFE